MIPELCNPPTVQGKAFADYYLGNHELIGSSMAIVDCEGHVMVLSEEAAKNITALINWQPDGYRNLYDGANDERTSTLITGVDKYSPDAN